MNRNRTFGTSSRGSQNNPRATSSTVCQKCLKTGEYQVAQAKSNRSKHLYGALGHFTYECKFKRPYVTRPSRTQLLENPSLFKKVQPPPDVPPEFKKRDGVANKILEEKEKERQKKRKR
ncbi:hypothetical protein FRC05_001550 [Tulasnella sp. 425]|nr:hypothetical protein FRC05_001550 [Tulasnella sp. 425]